jgi:hypothetical protein
MSAPPTVTLEQLRRATFSTGQQWAGIARNIPTASATFVLGLLAGRFGDDDTHQRALDSMLRLSEGSQTLGLKMVYEYLFANGIVVAPPARARTPPVSQHRKRVALKSAGWRQHFSAALDPEELWQPPAWRTPAYKGYPGALHESNDRLTLQGAWNRFRREGGV